MLGRMEPIELETMRRMSQVGGFTWTDEDLEAIRSTVERTLGMLAALERVPLAGVEPTTQYRLG